VTAAIQPPTAAARRDPALIPRPRLVRRLDAGVRGPLTLLAAPAGAGKSALVRGWAARQSGLPVAWLVLERADSEPRRFWRGALDALRAAGVPVAAGHPGEDAEALLGLLEEALADLPNPVVLVLDDLHEVGDSPAIAELDRLLRHPPPALRVVVATRADPSLRIGRMRLEGALTELRADELAFTAAETGELLASAGVEVPPDTVVALWERTEGWAAALRLAALAMREHPEPARFVAEFAGVDATMADYLLGEVLACQPPELREFLLRISVLHAVSGDLADALTGRAGSAGLLARLEHEHALVAPADPARTWHRLHPLFAELLRSELHYRSPETVPELHRRAAAWFEAHDRPTDALHHAAAAQDWSHVAALAGAHWVQLLLAGELSPLRGALERLPLTPAGADPALALAVAGAHVDAGDEPAARRWFDAAQARRDAVPDDRRADFDLATAAVGLLRGRLRGDLDAAMGHAQRLLHDAPEGAGADAPRALALSQLGIAELWNGELERARRNLEAARGAARAARLDWLRLTALAYLALDALLRGRFERTTALSADAEVLARRRGWHRSWPVGLTAVALAGVAFQRNRLDEAERQHARAAERLEPTGDRPLQALLALQRAELQAAHGRHEAALDALQEAREWLREWPIMPAVGGVIAGLEATLTAALGEPDAAVERLAAAAGTQEAAVALARLRLRAGEPADALASLQPFLAQPRTPLRATRVEGWVLAALAHDALAEHGEAAEALEHALDGAEAGGLRRPFLTDGALIAPVLRRQLRNGSTHGALVGELLAAVERPAASRTAAVLPEALSEREAAVLRFLPTMLSNQEIAAELFVSVNTVKTHLKAIYRKLGVEDRRGAVRRARELALLGPQ
jgi:LuxR family transcriptional regulator, maltose regulon positive regulatory protein